MVVHTSLDVGVPYDAVRGVLVCSPPWLSGLVTTAVADALEQASVRRCSAEHHDAFCRVGRSVRCVVGPPRVTVDDATVPLRWLSELEPHVFPSTIDAALRARPAGGSEQAAELVLSAAYALATPPADAGLFDRVVEEALDGYLIGVASQI
jgi:hypothetical protein